jgi:hypothetical protein
MRTIVCSLITAALILFPYIGICQDAPRPAVPLLPKPAWEVVDGRAVMDFPSTKALVELYAQYQFLHTVYALDTRIISELMHARALAAENAAFWKDQAAIASKQRDDAIRAEAQSRVWSVKDGALPWVVVGLVSTLLLGSYVGYSVGSK